MIACDLGSNTLRIVEFDCKRKRRLRSFEKSVRTAKNLHLTGIISQDFLQRIDEALIEAKKIFDFKTKEVHCVSTEAMRVAKNSKDIVEEIYKNHGLRFEIIDAKQEASLTLLGVENGMLHSNVDRSSYVLLDLGGASTEISFKQKDDIYSQSFPFGIVLVAEKYKTMENIKKSLPKELKVLESFVEKNRGTFQNFIATAGTPTSVCAFLQGIDYKSYDYEKINGKKLHIKDFETALEGLLKLPQEKREQWVGTNRSDLVCAGILITIFIMKKLGFTECTVIDDGLSEGLAMKKCNTTECF